MGITVDNTTCSIMCFVIGFFCYLDTRRPDMQCPDDITVIARPGSPSEMVSWKIDVDDNSLPVDPDAKVTVHSSHVSPHNFTIGRHGVSVIVTDKNGNKATCWFRVIVRGNLVLLATI